MLVTRPAGQGDDLAPLVARGRRRLPARARDPHRAARLVGSRSTLRSRRPTPSTGSCSPAPTACGLRRAAAGRRPRRPALGTARLAAIGPATAPAAASSGLRLRSRRPTRFAPRARRRPGSHLARRPVPAGAGRPGPRRDAAGTRSRWGTTSTEVAAYASRPVDALDPATARRDRSQPASTGSRSRVPSIAESAVRLFGDRLRRWRIASLSPRHHGRPRSQLGVDARRSRRRRRPPAASSKPSQDGRPPRRQSVSPPAESRRTVRLAGVDLRASVGRRVRCSRSTMGVDGRGRRQPMPAPLARGERCMVESAYLPRSSLMRRSRGHALRVDVAACASAAVPVTWIAGIDRLAEVDPPCRQPEAPRRGRRHPPAACGSQRLRRAAPLRVGRRPEDRRPRCSRPPTPAGQSRLLVEHGIGVGAVDGFDGVSRGSRRPAPHGLALPQRRVGTVGGAGLAAPPARLGAGCGPGRMPRLRPRGLHVVRTRRPRWAASGGRSDARLERLDRLGGPRQSATARPASTHLSELPGSPRGRARRSWAGSVLRAALKRCSLGLRPWALSMIVQLR